MNTRKMLQEVISYDKDWCKIKNQNPEMGPRFAVYLKNDHDDTLRILFDHWRIDDVGYSPDKEIEHPFYLGDHIKQVELKAFAKGWKIYSP